MWFALPRLAMIMFCRAYSANYLYGAAIQLWFLVPLRLREPRTTEASWPACIAYAVLGLVAGASNEHTGPTLCAFVMGYAGCRYWHGGPSRLSRARRARRAPVGFALIFFAPGQSERYDDLAQRVTLVGRLLQRGITGNLDIYRDFVLAAAPLLVLLVLALALAAADPLTERGDGIAPPARCGSPRCSSRAGAADHGDRVRVAQARAAVLSRVDRAAARRVHRRRRRRR